LRLFSFGGYGLPLAALALMVFGAYDSYPGLPNAGLATKGGLAGGRLHVPNLQRGT